MSKEEGLKWKRKDKLNFAKKIEEIAKMSKQVIARDIVDVNKKIEGLSRMGLISNNDALDKLKKKMSELKL